MKTIRPAALPAVLAALLLAACSEQAAQNSPAAASSAPAAASVPAEASAASASAPAAAGLKGVDVRKENIGGDFKLTNGKGEPMALSDLKGKVVMLSFGFTNCPDVCPTELLTYSDTLKQLGDKAKDVAVVFVSVDPERDSPAVIGKYVTQFHPDFIGLTDTEGGEQLALAKQQYRIVSAKTEIKSDTLYNIDHSSGTYLIDKKGETAYFEPFGADAEAIAADIRKLL